MQMLRKMSSCNMTSFLCGIFFVEEFSSRNKTTNIPRSAFLVLSRTKNVFAVFFMGFFTYLLREQTCSNAKIVTDCWLSLQSLLTWISGTIQVGAFLLYP